MFSRSLHFRTDEPEGDGSRFAMLAACDSQFQTIVEDSSHLMSDESSYLSREDTLRTASLMVVDDTCGPPPPLAEVIGDMLNSRET
jgi:hypothetical protein